MSLQDDGSDDAAAQMAETMGFAAFGAQTRPSKKRRMNDAFIEPQQPQQAHGSAANSTPLGARQQQQRVELPLHKAVATAVNDDEIDLDADDGDEDSGGGAPAPAPAVAAAVAGLPPRPPVLSGPTSRPHTQQQQQRGGRAGPGGGGHGGPSSSSSSRQWWLDYYDPKFNENPWDQLEKSLGLEPGGSWLASSRGHARV